MVAIKDARIRARVIEDELVISLCGRRRKYNYQDHIFKVCSTKDPQLIEEFIQKFGLGEFKLSNCRDYGSLLDKYHSHPIYWFIFRSGASKWRFG